LLFFIDNEINILNCRRILFNCGLDFKTVNYVFIFDQFSYVLEITQDYYEYLLDTYKNILGINNHDSYVIINKIEHNLRTISSNCVNIVNAWYKLNVINNLKY